MKNLIWLCICQLIAQGIFAQSSIDSLRVSLFNAQNKENAVEFRRFSSRLGWEFLNQKQYDSARKYYYKALTAIPPDTDFKLQANILSGLGEIFGFEGKFDSCIMYYRGAVKNFTAINDTVNASYAENNLSIVLKNVGLYEEALESALHVVSTLKPSDQQILRGSCYNTIGSIYIRTRDYAKALEYYHLALINRKINNQRPDVARIHNNIGELFIQTRQYDSATHHLKRAIEIKRELNDLQTLSRTLNNLGKVSVLMGNAKNASELLYEALAIQKSINDPVGMIQVLNNLGELHIGNKHLKQAETYLKESEKIIRRAGTPDYLMQNLELQVKLDRERGDLASGMLHLEQLSAVRDSLLNADKDRSMQAMQIRYETQKKEQQIAMLEQQEEINQNRIRNNQMLIGTLILGLFLVTAVGLLAYFNFRNARTAKQKIELLLADTRHRIKNHLQTLASIFHLQTKHFTDHNMVLEAKSSESRVQAMSLLHQKFYSVNPGHTIDLRKYITDLVNQLVDIYGYRTENTIVSIDVDEINLDIDKALPLSLIVQELVSNAFKYAFDNEQTNRLTISIHLKPNGELITTVADNGAGMDVTRSGASQGFSLIGAFVQQLHGNLEVRTDNGTSVTISFPLTPLWKRHAS